MSSIDQRIVGLRFDNKQFEQGVGETMSSLDKLKSGLEMEGVGGALDKAGSKFNAFAAIGFSALQRLTNGAIDMGQKIAGAVLDPLVEGGKKRALNIEQAKFQFQGLGMDVEASMESALGAVKGTAFGLDEAAVVAAQFGASGMAAGEDMTNALRGISGVAAMAGSSYSDVGSIFTKVAGQGRLMGDDLNRLAVRGVNAAATLADSMGITEEQVRKMVTKGEIDFQTFADAMSEAFGEHATKANETYTGSLSNMRAAIARIGASFATSKFEKQRQIFNALTPVIDKVADALQPVMRLYDDFAQSTGRAMVSFLEGLDFTDLTGGIMRFVQGIREMNRAVKSYLKPIGDAWREVFPSGADSPTTILTDIADAFRRFAKSLILGKEGAATVKTVFVALFTTINELGSILSSVWSVIKTAFGGLIELAGAIWTAISPLISGFFNLFTAIEGGTPKLLTFSNIIAAISGALTGLINFVLKPTIGFFRALGAVFDNLISNDPSKIGKNIKNAFEPLADLGREFNVQWANALALLERRFAPVAGVIKKLFSGLAAVMSWTLDIAKSLGRGFLSIFEGLGEGIGSSLKTIDASTVMEGIKTFVLAGIGNGIRELIGSIKGITDGFGGFANIGTGISDALGALTGNLKAMQTNVRADTLLKIAAAIAVLALAMVAMALVDPVKLAASAGAMTVAFGELIGAMAIFEKITSGKGVAKMPLLAGSLLLLAGALVILSAAILILGSMDPAAMAQGLIGVAVAIGVLVAAAALLSQVSGGMARAAIGMGLMAFALLQLSGVIAIFGVMPMDMLIQGMLSVIVLLTALSAISMIVGAGAGNMLKASIGLMAMAAAINMLLVPITAFGLLPMDTLIQGMTALLVLLVGLGVASLAFGAMSGMMIKAAIGLNLMALAINMLVVPIIALGMVPMEALIQGLLGLVAVMAVLVAASILMAGATAGAVGMVGMAVAILLLTASLAALNAIGLEGIGIAILGLVGTLTVLGLASLLLGPIAPLMLALAGAMALFGVASLLLSTAVLVLAVGLMMLAPALMATTVSLLFFAQAALPIMATVPVMLALAVGLTAFGVAALIASVGAIALGGGLLALGIGLTLMAMFGESGSQALASFSGSLGKLLKHVPAMLAMSGTFAVLGAAVMILGGGLLILGAGAIAAVIGLTLISVIGFLASASMNSVTRALERIIPLSGGIGAVGGQLAILGRSLQAVSRNASSSAGGLTRMSNVLQVGRVALTAFTISLAQASGASSQLFRALIRTLQTSGRSIGVEFTRMVKHFVLFAAQVTASSGRIQSAVSNVMRAVVRAIQTGSRDISTRLASVVREFSTFATNLGRQAPRVATEGRNIINGLGTAILGAIPGITTSIRNGASNIGSAIVDGIVRGISNNSHRVSTASSGVANRALVSARQKLEIRSPSRAMFKIGTQTTQGLADGLSYLAGTVGDSASDVGNTALDELKRVMAEISDVVMADGDFVIRPVMDLSEINQQAQELASIFGSRSLNVDGDYRRAQTISTLRTPTPVEATSLDDIAAATSPLIHFVQNNSSPRPLSEIEIHRQTSNSLALAARSLRRINE